MKNKPITFNGQQFFITAIPGGLAHDHHSRIVAHLTAGLQRLDGIAAVQLMKREGALAAIMSMDVAQLGAAVHAMASRLSAEENRFLRELLLSTATCNGKPFLAALDDGDVIGGPLTVDYLLGHAIELSILPFTGLVGNAPPMPPAEPSKASTT